jgi:hypothetical protein
MTDVGRPALIQRRYKPIRGDQPSPGYGTTGARPTESRKCTTTERRRLPSVDGSLGVDGLFTDDSRRGRAHCIHPDHVRSDRIRCARYADRPGRIHIRHEPGGIARHRAPKPGRWDKPTNNRLSKHNLRPGRAGWLAPRSRAPERRVAHRPLVAKQPPAAGTQWKSRSELQRWPTWRPRPSAQPEVQFSFSYVFFGGRYCPHQPRRLSNRIVTSDGQLDYALNQALATTVSPVVNAAFRHFGSPRKMCADKLADGRFEARGQKPEGGRRKADDGGRKKDRSIYDFRITIYKLRITNHDLQPLRFHERPEISGQTGLRVSN